MKIIIYAMGTHYRAQLIARAMHEGFRRHGQDVEIRSKFNGVEGDIAVAYGWNHESVFSAYGKYLYFDLGYWNRRPVGAPKEGHHRLSISSWCPSGNMLQGAPLDRLKASGLVVAESCGGNNGILVAGMSEKSAKTQGFPFEKWDRETISLLQTATTRPVYYRPKPKKNENAPTIQQALSLCSSVVAYCSNVAVDGIIAGCSVFVERGIGRAVSVPSLSDIANFPPMSYQHRVQFLADVAYCQWTPQEMRNGVVWDHVRGLI